MNCTEAKQLMHEMLDDKRFTVDSNLLEKHWAECPSCSELWLEMQFLDEQLLALKEVEVPIDFSKLDWLPSQPRLASWLVAVIGGVSALVLMVWGFIVIWSLPAFGSVFSLLLSFIPDGAVITQVAVNVFKTIVMIGAVLAMFIRFVLNILFAHPALLFMTTSPVLVLLFYLIKLSRQASMQ